MQRQHSPLVAQGPPRRSRKNDFDILLCSPSRRPDADLPAPSNLEVRDPFDPDKRAFGGVLKYAPPPVFRYGGMSSGDLDQHIDALVTMRRCRHAGERYVGTRAPAAKHVS